jgi:flagellar basal-body rod modification protein FlgD
MPDFQMSSTELNRTNIQVNEANKKIGVNIPGEKNSMGKDQFLRLLVTQLSHQDPTKPMEDREFITQMAQFSSLEQMSNLNSEVRNLMRSQESTQAFGLLGKRVEAMNPATKEIVTGEVSAVFYNQGQVRLKVNNQEISMQDIHAVLSAEDKKRNN